MKKQLLLLCMIILTYNAKSQTEQQKLNADSMAAAGVNNQYFQIPKEVKYKYTGYYEFKSDNFEIYKDGDFVGIIGTMYIHQISNSKIIVSLNYEKGKPSYNSSGIVETLILKNNKAVWSTTNEMGKCGLTFLFYNSKIQVSQKLDNEACGFSPGIFINCDFKKINSNIPTDEELRIKTIEENITPAVKN